MSEDPGFPHNIVRFDDPWRPKPQPDLDALEEFIKDQGVLADDQGRALIAEVRRLRERYEPKDARWNMSYYEWVATLNRANQWIEDWRRKAEDR